MRLPVAVKICGVMRPEDARLVSESGADFVGVILSPGFSRSLSLGSAAGVMSRCSVGRAGVFVDTGPAQVIDTARRLRLDVVQLHGNESPEETALVSNGGPWDTWKAVRVGGLPSLEHLAEYANVASGALVDAWHPSIPGGRGVAFPWDGVGDQVRGAAPQSAFIAAGGLTPDSVCDAITALRPDVVDVSSGVEVSLGTKDPARVRLFVQAARGCASGRTPEVLPNE